MIIDTTYLLPLARIRVRRDLLRAIADGNLKVDIDFRDLKVSLISIFELQAKAFKLEIPPNYVYEAVDTIFKSFYVVPFYKRDVIFKAYELRGMVDDYIDSVILATAIVLGEDLVTEDKLIHKVKSEVEKRYNLRVYCFDDLAG